MVIHKGVWMSHGDVYRTVIHAEGRQVTNLRKTAEINMFVFQYENIRRAIQKAFSRNVNLIFAF